MFVTGCIKRTVNENYSFDIILLPFMLRVSACVKTIIRRQFNKTYEGFIKLMNG